MERADLTLTTDALRIYLLPISYHGNYLLAQVEYHLFAWAGLKVRTHPFHKPTPITRCLAMAGQKPDNGLSVNLVETSTNPLVRILKRRQYF